MLANLGQDVLIIICSHFCIWELALLRVDQAWKSAVHSFLRHVDDPLECLYAAIEGGGDTDTTAAKLDLIRKIETVRSARMQKPHKSFKKAIVSRCIQMT